MSKFLYPIYKLKTKSYIKWWLYHKKAGGSGVLSEILEGFSFNLENTLNRKFKLFEIEGNIVQDGTPSLDNEVPIKSAGDNGSINEKITNSDETQEQDYSMPVQQPMRSIGDVRDCFVKKSDGKLYERHYIKYLELLISAMNNSENYPGWTNVQQIKNDFPNINTQLITKTSFLCNIFEKTSRIMVINTVGNNSILYLDKSLLNLTQTQWKENYPNLVLKLGYISPEPLDLPCTPEQIQQLENLPSTYKDFTIIQSQDETPAHLKIQYYKEG